MTQITKLLSLCWLTFEADDLSYTQKLISEPQRSSLIHTSTENSLLRVQTTKYIHMLSAQKLMFVADLKNRTALCYNAVSFLHIVHVYQYLGSRNCGPGTKATMSDPNFICMICLRGPQKKTEYNYFKNVFMHYVIFLHNQHVSNTIRYLNA